MKFLCSILILAGVFALNDAFPSSDDQRRLINDQLIMEDLKLLIANRAAGSSIQCSNDYLADLTKCLENYNSVIKGCDDAEQNLIVELNKAASEKIEEYKSNISSTCADDCPSDDTVPSDQLDCIEQLSLKNSRSLSDISVQTSTYKVVLQKSIDDAKGVKDVCTQDAYSTYSMESQDVEDKFKKCVQS